MLTEHLRLMKITDDIADLSTSIVMQNIKKCYHVILKFKRKYNIDMCPNKKHKN